MLEFLTETTTKRGISIHVSLNYLWHQIKTIFNGGRNCLELVSLIRLRDGVFTHALLNIQCVRHGYDALGIDSLHLFDQVEDAVQLDAGFFGFFVAYAQAGQSGDVKNILRG
jgi:hypothetical protein